MSECTFEGCQRPHVARGLCRAHYGQWHRGTPLHEPRKSPAPPGTGYTTPRGYRRLYLPHHPNANRSGYVMEHTVVMADIIGRPLHAHETVHHLNGVRYDNRPANLELWSTSQPYGQRIEDKTAWAKEWLAEYEPDSLA